MKQTMTAAFAALLLTACATTDDGGARSYASIAAPMKAGVGTKITDADAGKTVAVRVGEKIAIALVGVPTAGYAWGPAAVPAFLAPDGEAGGPTSEAQLEPGFAGGNHWEVFFFDATAAGAGELRFEQRRIWDEDGPADRTFSVVVRAQ